jgi:hypothetical protein
MIRAISTALVAVFLCLPAAAQECVHPAMVYAQATAPVPTARMLEILSGADAHWVLQNYNAIEPVSTHVVDHIAVVTAQGVPVFLLIGYTADNCTVFSDTVPVALYQAWRANGA